MDAPRNAIPADAPRFADEPARSASWEDDAATREVGIDESLLLEADRIIQKEYPKMYSFLVAKDARLAFERYYGGADLRTPMDLRSATKSVTAAALGSLQVEFGAEQGAVPTLGELFEDRLPRAASEALKSTTLRHLLTMTSGLHWKTGKRLGELFIPRMHRSRHWVRFALRLPVNAETRGVFQYRSADSHLLSAAVTAMTGRTAAAIAQEALFEPLRIRTPAWEADPQGITIGHVGLALTARDLAKLGWLHATGGVWEGRRLLPESYVRFALTPHSEGLPAFGRYGGHWWIARTASGDAVRCALGHGGQIVFVVPEKGLVAVFTANPKVSRWKHPLQLFERYVLPAATAKGGTSPTLD